MDIKASLNNFRTSPRKVRLVAGLVRGKQVDQALAQLQFSLKGSALPISKLLKSAVANAVNNYELSADNLYIKEIKVDEGPTMKRWMPKAHGRATPLRKRTSHVSVTLGEIKESGVTQAKKQKLEAPVKLGSKPTEDEGVKVEQTSPADTGSATELGKEIIDPRGLGKGKHTKLEGGKGQGFKEKVFRRKSG